MSEPITLSTLQLDLPDETHSLSFAKKLAACLSPGTVISFSGDLGAGKTTIIRAMLRTLGIQSAIKSPTFSLVESYEARNLHIHHFDLYRIQDEHELDYLGFRDYFSDEAVCCIEWPEHAGSALGKVDVHLKLIMKGSGRAMQLQALSAAGNRMLIDLKDG